MTAAGRPKRLVIRQAHSVMPGSATCFNSSHPRLSGAPAQLAAGNLGVGLSQSTNPTRFRSAMLSNRVRRR
jgi:hypothetical protein